MDPDQMFTEFKEAYLGFVKAQEIAKHEAQIEQHQMCAEMDEMRAWDEYALKAMELRGPEAPVEVIASDCAKFANELLKHRRTTFLVGDDK